MRVVILLFVFILTSAAVAVDVETCRVRYREASSGFRTGIRVWNAPSHV